MESPAPGIWIVYRLKNKKAEIRDNNATQLIAHNFQEDVAVEISTRLVKAEVTKKKKQPRMAQTGKLAFLLPHVP